MKLRADALDDGSSSTLSEGTVELVEEAGEGKGLLKVDFGDVLGDVGEKCVFYSRRSRGCATLGSTSEGGS